MINTVLNEDCLEGMKRIASGSVDMILCDLPYGTTACKWDVIIPFEPLWRQYERIIKPNGAIVLTAQPPFDKVLGCSNLTLFKYEWIWNKIRGTGHLNAKKMPLKASENVLVFYKNAPTYIPQMTVAKTENVRPLLPNGSKSDNYGKVVEKYYSQDYDINSRYPVNIINISSQTQECNPLNRLHPTQKPVALFEYLIRTYTNKGETVLDNCAGSFTTAIACENTGRNWICIEKESKYCEIGTKRIEENRRRLAEAKQVQTLFQ